MLKILLATMFMTPLLSSSNSWIFSMLTIMLFTLFCFNLSTQNNPLDCSYSLMTDVLSNTLILLTLWIIFLMFLSSMKYNLNKHKKEFNFVLIILMFTLTLTFSTMNLMMFYLAFESTLIPTLILIMGWGNNPERTQAGAYFMMYTLMASLPLLLAIMLIYKNSFTLWMPFLCNQSTQLLYMYIALILAFLVKTPMFLTHLWLPKAHVEAPISGSMILAGVLLKLGSYGLMRILSMVENINNNLNHIWISIMLMGSIITSLICLRQTDLKALIAYSSVVHMGTATSAILTMNYWGLSGGLALLIAHGLASSGLFCLSNINYERSNSRSILINKGILLTMPNLSLWWFLLSVTNMSGPPSINLFSEIKIISSLASWDMSSMLPLALIAFLSGVYTLFIFSNTQHGKPLMSHSVFMMGKSQEYLLMFLHWMPINIIIMKPEIISLWF
uniref:NADH-ubiquinone oxidoreductase chain 4 n=1 Tax=Hutchinsoniella macracantha TaxID=84335 RepID=Q6SKZ7_9CRUS|nr:NADH dehydrogenase subunit 4 [Hutchinsoniella macracantha]